MLQEYQAARSIHTLVHPTLLDLHQPIINVDGQVRIFDSGVDIDQHLDKTIFFLDITVAELIYGDRNRDGSALEIAVSSYFIDCVFENLSGTLSSAVSVYESRVTFLSFRPANSVIHF